MYKAILAAMAGTVSCQKFPGFDAFHEHCQLTTTLHASCSETWDRLELTVRTMADPAQGTIELAQELRNKYVWATRYTPLFKYYDDFIFELAPT